jgi:hypothetical protein
MKRRSLNGDSKKRDALNLTSRAVRPETHLTSRAVGRFNYLTIRADSLQRLIGETVATRLTSLRGEPVHYRAPYGGATSS